MTRRALLATTWLLLAGCDLQPTPSPAIPPAPGSAADLGMFSTERPEELEEQAVFALQQDAYRRETRFLDAAAPGYLFAATRVAQGEVDAGAWSNEELFRLGGQLFFQHFTRELGFGAKDLPHFSRFHTGQRGGPDAMSCNGCHWRGGPAGAGDGADNAYLDGDGVAQSSTLPRNPPSLAGAGVVELLASEMTAELARQRESLLAKAREAGVSQEAPLTAKGVEFGTLVARPDGLVDVTKVEGVDADLVIRPFGWKGTFATVRDAVEDALLVHHGMESSHLVATAPPERIGPYGGLDPDGDGVVDEIAEGQVSVLTLFVAMQELPTIELSRDQDILSDWPAGQKRFVDLGCAKCHVPSLTLDSALYVLPSREGGAPAVVDLVSEGSQPRLDEQDATGAHEVFLFSDLKRHDVGPLLADSRWDRGVRPEQFLTRPLWGSARSRPYLHDGRSPTAEDAILLHGGEAQESRDAYAALPEEERAAVRVYLMSLTRGRRVVAP